MHVLPLLIFCSWYEDYILTSVAGQAIQMGQRFISGGRFL